MGSITEYELRNKFLVDMINNPGYYEKWLDEMVRAGYLKQDSNGNYYTED